MNCILEFNDPFIRFKFEPSISKQKVLIEILLNHTKLDRNALASILEISLLTLNDVQIGAAFLPEIPAKCLAQLFLILFSD